jgi:hypothetical protein
MSGKNAQLMSDHTPGRSDTKGRTSKEVSDPIESPEIIGVTTDSVSESVRPVGASGSDTQGDFVSVAKAAELEGITERRITGRCAKREHKYHYCGAEKVIVSGVATWRIPANSLSNAACAKYRTEQKAARLAAARRDEAMLPAVIAPQAVPDAEYSQLWDRYERRDSNFKRMSNEALEILLAYVALKETGVSVGFAEKAIKESHGASRSTIRRYVDYTKGHPRQHWLPLLCPRYHGGRARAEFTPDAYEFIVALKVRSPATNLRVLIRAAEKEGAKKGWILPSEDTIAKRLKEEPAWTFGGMVALERGFPTIERDYASLALHACWESDGRKADVFCVWPDGTVNRPFVIVIRDVRSRHVLAVRICYAPDAEAVLGVYGAALTNAQAVPHYFKLDNGREYANKAFTGHQKTRYRFKYASDEARGILTAMGVKASWAKPGDGRNKPIESWWNVIAENCDKSPEFAGAYCGKDVLSKPEDFDRKKAVPVESYAAKLIQTVIGYGNTPHRGHGMNLRKPTEVYNEMSATAVARRPDASEIRRCKMGVISLSLDKKDSSFRFKMKGYPMPMKYWAEPLSDLSVSERNGKFNVHYDWGEPNSPVAVYRGDVFICDAYPQGRVDFIESEDGEKVKNHMEAKGRFMKPRRQAINAAKARGVVALPDGSGALTLPPMVTPNQASVIAPSTKPRPVAAPVSPIHAIPGRPGESINSETGEVYVGEEARRAQANGQQDERETEAELEEMARRMREKNLPAYLR